MALVDELNAARKKLFESLGDSTKLYCQLMKQWFSMKISKEEFDLEVRKAMNSDQTRLHNDFLLCLFNKCTFLTSDSARGRYNSKKSKHGKNKRTEKSPFHPGDRETPPPHILENAQRYCVQEYFLPDQSFIMGRLMLGAWELGMDGAEDTAAECLVIAVQYFIKNILTAIMSQRSGYKMNNKKFIHSVGVPVANPWLCTQVPPKETIKLKRTAKGKKVPLDTLREHREIFEIACATTNNVMLPKAPISAYDLLAALMVHKSTIPSHTVYAHNLERIISLLDHPSWNDLEAEKFLKT